MSDLAYLQEQIAATNSELLDLEGSIAQFPEELTLSIMANSLRGKLEDLHSSFEEEASSIGLSVCSYRLFSEENNPSISIIGEALSSFQTLISATYSAIVEGVPRKSLKIPAEHKAASNLGWGFSYPGSVGVVLTIKRTASLFNHETPLDDAFKTAIYLTEVNDAEEMAEQARNLGAGPVRAIYLWSNCLSKAKTGVEIRWKRNPNDVVEKLIDYPIFETIRDIVSSMSDAIVTTFTVNGVLEAIDHKKNKFTIETNDEDLIRGSISETLNDHGWETKKSYNATIESTTVTQYSTEKTKTSYKLIDLVPEPE